MKHARENIADKIDYVVEEFGLIDKVFSLTPDNVSSNAKAMDTLTPMHTGLGVRRKKVTICC